MPSFGDKTTSWEINKTNEGFDIEITSSGDLRAIPDSQGEVFQFSDKSRITLNFKFALRHEGEELKIATLGGQLDVVAFDTEGNPLTPAAAREAANSQGA